MTAMQPLVARARVSTGVMLPWHPPALDAMLMAAVATRDGLPPIWAGEAKPLPIPLATDRGIYLASVAQYTAECHSRRHINRKFPVLEAQSLGSKSLRSVNISGGPAKSYRMPTSVVHPVDDTLAWYAIGDVDEVLELLTWIEYVGKKRSVGLGRVEAWSVEPVEPWEGFPVLRNGVPLRPLPLDWPGLGEHRVDRRVLTPPYWERWREEPCAVP